jgi:hypothetical protein
MTLLHPERYKTDLSGIKISKSGQIVSAQIQQSGSQACEQYDADLRKALEELDKEYPGLGIWD